MGKRRKKAQAEILTVVLIILISIIAIAILWNVVIPLVQERSESVGVGQFSIGLEIRDLVLFENGVSIISVNRDSGNEELDGLKFVFYDGAGNSVTRDGEEIKGLETKSYSFSPLPEIGKIVRVGVAPIINGDLGIVVESEPGSVLKIPSSVISWWRFDDLTDFVGRNTCVGGGVSNGVLNGKVDCTAVGLGLIDNMAISFWIKGSNPKTIISKGAEYMISIDEDHKINFVSGSSSGTSDYELIDDWNHVVISIAVSSEPLSKIYLNNAVKTFSVNSFNGGDENLIINGELGEVDDVMIFNYSLADVSGIYNTQKK